MRMKDPDYIEAWTRWLRKPNKERIKLSRQWRIKGCRGLSPNAYQAKNGTVVDSPWKILISLWMRRPDLNR
jgi:hypothetical protein